MKIQKFWFKANTLLAILTCPIWGIDLILGVIFLRNTAYCQGLDPAPQQKSVKEIQALIDAASPGDVITISGEYGGCVEPDKAVVINKAVTLRGDNSQLRATIFGSPQCDAPTVFMSASRARLESLNIRNTAVAIRIGITQVHGVPPTKVRSNIVKDVAVSETSVECLELHGSFNKVFFSSFTDCGYIFVDGDNTTLMANTIGEHLSIHGSGLKVLHNVFTGGNNAAFATGDKMRFIGNAFLNGFSEGIRGEGNKAVLERNVFQFTGRPLRFVGNNNSFSNNEIVNSSYPDFSDLEIAQVSLRGNNWKVSKNRLVNNTGIGIRLIGNDARFTGNVVQGSEKFGIVVSGQNNMLRGNKSGDILPLQANGDCDYVISTGNIDKGQNRAQGQLFQFNTDGVSCGGSAAQAKNLRTFVMNLDTLGGYFYPSTSFNSLGLQVIPEWNLSSVADVNGDRRPDLIWRNNTTGVVVLTLLDGLDILEERKLGKSPLPPEWEIVGVGDVDGDKRADLVWRNRKTLRVTFWLLDGLTILETRLARFASPGNMEKGILGDLNADGKADLLWQSQ